MSTHDNTTHPTSLVRRRIAVAMIVVGVGAILPAFASADASYECPAGHYLSWTENYESSPIESITVGNIAVTYLGFGVSDGHVTYGDGSPLNGMTVDILAATGGEPASDVHYCKFDETATTTLPTETTAPPTETTAPPTETTAPPTETTAPPTETTAPPTETTAPPTETTAPPTETTAPPTETTAPPTETTAPPTETTAPPTETTAPPTETTAPPTETTAPPTETTAPPTETTAPPTETTAPPTETTAPPTTDGGTTTTTLVDQESGTTTTTLVDQESATTTTIVTELPRTGSGVSNLTAFGGLLILLGGLMLHSTRRIEALD